jgi:hypothetical protein
MVFFPRDQAHSTRHSVALFWHYFFLPGTDLALKSAQNSDNRQNRGMKRVESV